MTHITHIERSHDQPDRALIPFRNTIAHGDCIRLMRGMLDKSIDLILTDPPYLVRYQSRDGRSIANDADDAWLRPAFAQMYRILRPNRFCVSFYGWNRADAFLAAWRAAGFHVVGHFVFTKRYASATRFVRYQHEQAYLLAKGRPQRPLDPIPDVLDWRYTGNRLHPTQKPLSALMPLIKAFSAEGEIVFDPFCGSGSTLDAARRLKRDYYGIELDQRYCAIARQRLRVSAST